MYCLDSNIVIEILRGNESLKSKIEKMEGIYDFFVTSTTLCELFKGAYIHSKSREKSAQLKIFMSNCEIAVFDIEACEEYGRLYEKLKRTGMMIPEFDIMIASIVKTKDFTLITRDKKHFNGLGIKVEKW